MIDIETRKYLEIFWPGTIEEILSLQQRNCRFAHYTSADTAMKIIENGELWLRNSAVMNDFSEIAYGIDLIYGSLSTDVGNRFRAVVKRLLPEDDVANLDSLLDGWIPDWQNETYLSCVSLHSEDEDEFGRLSMWRAYGDVALVVKNTPMMAVTDKLNVFSIPVRYWSKATFRSHLGVVASNMETNFSYLQGLGREAVSSLIYHQFQNVALGSKHPGFQEEKEWRVYYRPSERPSDTIGQKIVTVRGVPQKIFTLPLRHSPDEGLFNADIPSLIDRVIIGPSDFGFVAKMAFVHALQNVGVENAQEKVVVSDIPLRSQN